MNDGNAVDRIIQDLRGLVAAADAGTRLPSVRELTTRHQASPVTVAEAVRRLVAQGLIETRPGKGTFVAALPHERRAPDLSWQTVALGARRPGEEEVQALLALPPAGAIPLSGGYLDADLQPAATLGAALARAARQPTAWQRWPVEGREDLRAWFAREAGARLRADDMVICPGGQAALSSALRALAAPGDTLLVESPTYLGALAAARAAGLRVVPVPADADGVVPNQLAAAFARTGARLFYCQPLYANPTGATLAAHRRVEVAGAIRDAGAFLIEDDYARDLTIDGEAPLPLAADDPDGHVIYLRSLTKSVAPGLRVAAIGARGPAGARLRSARLLDDFFVAGPLQQATLEFVTAPAWTRHRRTLRTALRARREALLTALRRHLPELALPTVPRGGLHLWVRLPDSTDDVALAAAATAEGVVVFPGRPWYAAEPPAPHLRLTYAAAPPDLMDEAVRRLARALRKEATPS
ncbi:DNA-binding transcriptional regulator, MocR family, contains an aminotransferase domain [Micromonospora echinaurantiaca]|uniref:DNA-binding transcriptional regulator, MocR family, contains an aminotransferase domain n=1 Tax=Micromonospora echinaurantiaca TaxID=47857 RepID=A0A1C5IH45_9ACTN|nr:PLP-dependent aminotransferase family protein [Micromonospora echinaurantiaca]SCG57393.1 DNA-binding transcriptional regulator, MocR family, contains an aminotransferase domain [Micromonospora echinaurantiaca]